MNLAHYGKGQLDGGVARNPLNEMRSQLPICACQAKMAPTFRAETRAFLVWPWK